jgi:hypothetical protein
MAINSYNTSPNDLSNNLIIENNISNNLSTINNNISKDLYKN